MYYLVVLLVDLVVDSFFLNLSGFTEITEKKMEIPELWEALLSGKYDLANQMINRGANINELKKVELYSEMTLLHYAAWKGNLQCIRVLANLGANVHARDNRNLTPLHYAAIYGTDPNIVEVLINEGAIVDARGNNQMTPLLHTAAKRASSIEVAQKLIARGASLEAVTTNYENALHLAIMCSNLEMVKVLISHGINIDAKDRYGNTPLLMSFRKREPFNSEIVSI